MRGCFIDLQTLQIFMGEKITSRAAGQPGCVFAGSDCTDRPFFRALRLRQFSLKPPFTEQKGKSGPCLSYAFQHQFHLQKAQLCLDLRYPSASELSTTVARRLMSFSSWHRLSPLQWASLAVCRPGLALLLAGHDLTQCRGWKPALCKEPTQSHCLGKVEEVSALE